MRPPIRRHLAGGHATAHRSTIPPPSAHCSHAGPGRSTTPVAVLAVGLLLTLRNRHPSLVGCPDGQDGPPLDMDRYRRWVGAVVDTFLPLGVHDYQIGNEVFLNDKFWCGTYEEYIELLANAAEVIRAHGGNRVRVVTSGFASGLSPYWGQQNAPSLEGLRMLVARPEIWDVMDFHLYRTAYELYESVRWLVDTLAVAGLGDREILASECGGPHAGQEPGGYSDEKNDLGVTGNLIRLDSTVVYIDWNQEAVDVPDGGDGKLAVSPNPCNGHVTVQFTPPRETDVTISVLDLSGRVVRVLASGTYQTVPGTVSWDCRDDAGRPAGSGIYHIALETADGVMVRKVTLVK